MALNVVEAEGQGETEKLGVWEGNSMEGKGEREGEREEDRVEVATLVKVEALKKGEGEGEGVGVLNPPEGDPGAECVAEADGEEDGVRLGWVGEDVGNPGESVVVVVGVEGAVKVCVTEGEGEGVD